MSHYSFTWYTHEDNHPGLPRPASFYGFSLSLSLNFHNHALSIFRVLFTQIVQATRAVQSYIQLLPNKIEPVLALLNYLRPSLDPDGYFVRLIKYSFSGPVSFQLYCSMFCDVIRNNPKMPASFQVLESFIFVYGKGIRFNLCGLFMTNWNFWSF